MKLLDTIAAVGTPYGKGGVAMIRISGQDALEVADAVFVPKSGTPLLKVSPNTAVYGEIFSTGADGEKTFADDGMATFFKSPKSFTGEDTVEITCHGGIMVTEDVLSAVLSAGARLAQAGEFTRRAFISGKIRLSQAESLAHLLDAKSRTQLTLARGGLKGILSDKTSAIYEELSKILSSIYAKIDFPDEDLAEMGRDEIVNRVEDALDRTRAISATYRTGRAVAEGIRTVICGRTNAGKSSVYNRILGKEDAIVTDIEGTTRDVLRHTVVLGKTTLLLADTAGLRDTADPVENIGIDRSNAEIDSAELILAVFDGSKPIAKDDTKLIKKLAKLPVTVVALINKSDLDRKFDLGELEDYFDTVIEISAKNGSGFDTLASVIDKLFIDEKIDFDRDAVVTGARQYSALVRAAISLAAALHSFELGYALDACCADVELAMRAIGELDGREISEDIVTRIFSDFCVGK